MLARLESESATIHQAAAALYERTIDYGAHPNERAILTNLKMEESEDYVKFDLKYLSGDDATYRACLKSTAQVGVCVLDIFSLIYRHRLELSGLADRLDPVMCQNSINAGC